MKLYDQIKPWLHDRTQISVHRQLLVISGPELWAIEQAKMLIAKHSRVLWVGNSNVPQTHINNKQYRQFLGQEFQHVIINCYSGFRGNTAIALSGVVRSQGLMVVLCPDLSEWPHFPDPEWHNQVSFGFTAQLNFSVFIKILIQRILANSHIALLTMSEFKGSITPLNQPTLFNGSPPTLSQEQTKAVEAIIKVAIGHRNRPLVLSADRGRGKSSALGFAAAELIKQYAKKIMITAPSPATVERVFYYAKSGLTQSNVSKNRIESSGGSLTFCAIEDLLQIEHSVDMLFIDEAAALPTHLLTQLIDKFSRIVFSTTLHGYEGSGRGFELRIKPYLTQHKPQWKSLHLSQPMRWFYGDYLEAFWFEAFLMNETQDLESTLLNEPLQCTWISKKELENDQHSTQCIFQLLVNAHYQTSQDDLVRLYDAPEQHCIVIRQGKKIHAVALIIEEGGELLRPLQHNIASGQRRLKGHLVAQNISFQYSLADFACLKQWRISRLAVAPRCQGQGLGTVLLNYLSNQACEQNIDVLTTSFGLTADLLRFWQQNDYCLVNLSYKPEISSGEHSAQLIKVINPACKPLLAKMTPSLYQELLYQADKALQFLDTELLHLILKSLSAETSHTQYNKHRVKQFIDGHRPLLNCQRELGLFYLNQISEFEQTTKADLYLLVNCLIQNQTLSHLAKKYKLSGKAQIEQQIRATLKSVETNNRPKGF